MKSTTAPPGSKLVRRMPQHDAKESPTATPDTAATDVRKPDKPRRVPSRLGKGPTPGSWKPGQSGNPKGGTPRSGLALATTIRERIDPHKVLDLVCEYMQDEKVSTADKLDRLLPWLHAGFLKPPTATALHVTNETSGAKSFSHLTDAEVEAELARLDQLALPSSSESDTAITAAPEDEP